MVKQDNLQEVRCQELMEKLERQEMDLEDIRAIQTGMYLIHQQERAALLQQRTPQQLRSPRPWKRRMYLRRQHAPQITEEDDAVTSDPYLPLGCL